MTALEFKMQHVLAELPGQVAANGTPTMHLLCNKQAVLQIM